MAEKLRARMIAAGHDATTIELAAANPRLCAMLAQFYGLEEGGRGEEVTAVVNSSSLEKIETAVEQSPSDDTQLDTPAPATDAQMVFEAAQALFGGFTASQVRRLLAVCRYRRVSVDVLLQTMRQLRAKSWARGWVRTRDAAERLSPTGVCRPLAC